MNDTEFEEKVRQHEEKVRRMLLIKQRKEELVKKKRENFVEAVAKIPQHIDNLTKQSDQFRQYIEDGRVRGKKKSLYNFLNIVELQEKNLVQKIGAEEYKKVCAEKEAALKADPDLHTTAVTFLASVTIFEKRFGSIIRKVYDRDVSYHIVIKKEAKQEVVLLLYQEVNSLGEHEWREKHPHDSPNPLIVRVLKKLSDPRTLVQTLLEYRGRGQKVTDNYDLTSAR